MRTPPVNLLSRRQLLIGGTAAAGAVLLGACGDDSAEGASGTTAAASGDLALVQFFGGAPMFVAGEESRLPFGVADADGLLASENTPDRLTVQILGPDGTVVVDGTEVQRHDDGLPRSYFPLRVEIPEPGMYTARTEIDGTASEMSFKIDSAADVSVIRPGDPLPKVATPTTADPHGVNPICTNDPVCPLHEATLAETLEAGAPVALLVATPAFCQLAICGPVLDVLLGVRDAYPDVRFLHAEVYADPAKDLQTYAPIVEPLGLHFEPCLVLAGADGVVTQRIDTIYDAGELKNQLDQLTQTS